MYLSLKFAFKMSNFTKNTLFYILILGLCTFNPALSDEKINAGIVYEFYLDLQNQIPTSVKYSTKNLPQIKDEEVNIAYFKDFRPLNMLSINDAYIIEKVNAKSVKKQEIPKEYNINLKEGKIMAAAKIAPSYEELFKRAVSYKNKEKYKNALDSINEALKENPLSLEGHFLKADILRLCGKYRESVFEYTLAINIDPNCTDAYFNIAKILENTNNKELALQYYRHAYTTNPNDYEIRNIILSYERNNIN